MANHPFETYVCLATAIIYCMIVGTFKNCKWAKIDSLVQYYIGYKIFANQDIYNIYSSVNNYRKCYVGAEREGIMSSNFTRNNMLYYVRNDIFFRYYFI